MDVHYTPPGMRGRQMSEATLTATATVAEVTDVQAGAFVQWLRPGEARPEFAIVADAATAATQPS